jgi:hypothetical protein
MALSGIFGENSSSMLAKWLPVSWSCQEPAMKTGTSILCTKVAGATASRRALANSSDRASPSTSGDCNRSAWFAAQVVSPSAMRFAAQRWPAGFAPAPRSLAQWSAKPLLKMPP